MSAPPQPKDLIGSKDSAMKESQVAGVLTPIFAQFGLELEAVEIIPAGKRRLLRVVVDGDGPGGTGPLLDDIAEASKAASAALDSADVAGNAAYTLEVTSRGVSRLLNYPDIGGVTPDVLWWCDCLKGTQSPAGSFPTLTMAYGSTLTAKIGMFPSLTSTAH